jgi:L-ascorbate metabolism protein UlaG (beta-lactamase superfamily)
MGLVIRAEGEPTLYNAGDTGVFSDMALINAFYKPEIGLLPIGDRFTMDAQGAAYAARKFFDFKTVVPCHYATFPMLVSDAGAFSAAMEGSGVDVRVPAYGETLDLRAKHDHCTQGRDRRRRNCRPLLRMGSRLPRLDRPRP